MRKLHRIYAWVLGYFWLPCPMCGRMFGGHETGERHLTEYHNGVQRSRVCCKRHDFKPSRRLK